VGWIGGLRSRFCLSLFFFYSYSFPIFCFTDLDSNLNSNLFCRFELRSSSKTYPGYALA
jgi:hypothetical protein